MFIVLFGERSRCPYKSRDVRLAIRHVARSDWCDLAHCKNNLSIHRPIDCYNPNSRKNLAKSAMELNENKEPAPVSGRHLVLEWAYQSVYGTLWGMNHGGGLRPEVARELNETSPQLDTNCWLTDLESQRRELEKFAPQNLPEEDWAIRKKIEIARELELLAMNHIAPISAAIRHGPARFIIHPHPLFQEHGGAEPVKDRRG